MNKFVSLIIFAALSYYSSLWESEGCDRTKGRNMCSLENKMQISLTSFCPSHSVAYRHNFISLTLHEIGTKQNKLN